MKTQQILDKLIVLKAALRQARRDHQMGLLRELLIELDSLECELSTALIEAQAAGRARSDQRRRRVA